MKRIVLLTTFFYIGTSQAWFGYFEKNKPSQEVIREDIEQLFNDIKNISPSYFVPQTTMENVSWVGLCAGGLLGYIAGEKVGGRVAEVVGTGIGGSVGAGLNYLRGIPEKHIRLALCIDAIDLDLFVKTVAFEKDIEQFCNYFALKHYDSEYPIYYGTRSVYSLIKQLENIELFLATEINKEYKEELTPFLIKIRCYKEISITTFCNIKRSYTYRQQRLLY